MVFSGYYGFSTKKTDHHDITTAILVKVALNTINMGNNNITELRTIFQRESQNSNVYKQTKSVNNQKTVKTVMTNK